MGPGELLVIMFIILILFGAKKLPELAQGLGKGIREFKRASSEIQDELNATTLNTPKNTPAPKTETKEAKENESKDDHTPAS